MKKETTYKTIKGTLLITLMFFFTIGFSQNSETKKVIKHNNDQEGSDVYVNNVFYQDGDLYLDLVNSAKATTFYVNGKIKNSENNKIESIKYLVVLDSSNFNMLVIPADKLSYIEFNLTNGTTKSSDYVYYSVNEPSYDYMINNVSSVNNQNNITVVKNSLNQPSTSSSASAITLNLKKGSELSIDIFDLSGHKVSSIAHGFYPAGTLEINLTDKSLPNGIYICKLISSGNNQSFKFFNRN
jgi:hypothetical protein